MPPGKHSSSSHSSRSSSSRSSSSSSRSRSHSSSSHSSSSHSSRSHSSGSYSSRSYSSSYSSGPRIKSVYINKYTPKNIRNNSLILNGKNHNYVYYDEEWVHPKTNEVFHKGYYNEEGTYYGANDIAFKNPNGTYTAHFRCDYCGAEAEYQWSEGQYPTCKSCGATMSKTPVYVDELINVSNASKVSEDKKIIRGVIILIAFLMSAPGLFISLGILGSITSYNKNKQSTSQTSVKEDTPSNIDIFGNDIYLKKVSKKNSKKKNKKKNIYEICESNEEYDKHLSWDYGADSYYDYDTDCYIWYNTDVSPNLWQYWYDEVAGDDSEYGWMECEDNEWFIETESGWVKYDGDTSKLWHIKNNFDKPEDEVESETEAETETEGE